jgi:hypothetical protein
MANSKCSCPEVRYVRRANTSAWEGMSTLSSCAGVGEFVLGLSRMCAGDHDAVFCQSPRRNTSPTRCRRLSNEVINVGVGLAQLLDSDGAARGHRGAAGLDRTIRPGAGVQPVVHLTVAPRVEHRQIAVGRVVGGDAALGGDLLTVSELDVGPVRAAVFPGVDLVISADIKDFLIAVGLEYVGDLAPVRRPFAVSEGTVYPRDGVVGPAVDLAICPGIEDLLVAVGLQVRGQSIGRNRSLATQLGVGPAPVEGPAPDLIVGTDMNTVVSSPFWITDRSVPLAAASPFGRIPSCHLPELATYR